MKHILIFGAFIASLGLYSQESELIGEWLLVKADTEMGSVYPIKKDYLLTLTSEEFNYNLEVNTCKGTYTVKDDQLIYTEARMTFACCDGREDPIAKLIRYQGTYVLYQDQLIITNDKGTTLYLERL
jgi:hypothetical protein